MKIIFISFIVLTACDNEHPLEASKPSSIFVLQSNYESSLIQGYSEQFQERSQVAADGDSRLVLIGQNPAVLQRGRADNLLIFNTDLSIKHQLALPANSNPQDAKISGGSLYISLYAKAELLRYNAQDFGEKSAIDLSPFNDNDQRPEASSLYQLETGILLLAIQNLDFSGVEPSPPEESRILFIDPIEAQVRYDMAIPGNPFGRFIELPNGDLAIACNRSWDIDENAGLYRFNPQSKEGYFITLEEQLQGNILSIANDETRIYLIVAQNDFTTRFYDIELESGILSEAYTTNSSKLGCIKTLKDGRIMICDQSPQQFGLRFVDPETKIISDERIKTTLPPLQIIEG
jgi:hypothetical protein